MSEIENKVGIFICFIVFVIYTSFKQPKEYKDRNPKFFKKFFELITQISAKNRNEVLAFLTRKINLYILLKINIFNLFSFSFTQLFL